MANGTFQRHELKYMLDSRQRAALERAMAGIMEADAYGESTICSLYYDTPDFRLIRRSLEKPAYKEKLRLRSYGQARPQGDVFVELKKKYDGIVYKRRISLTEREATAWLAGAEDRAPEGQIAREIRWFRDYYRDLAPAMVLCYDRVAYFCPTDPDLRITLDRNIRWRVSELTLTRPPYGEPLLQPGRSLLEIKASAAMPLWLTRTLSENGIRKTSFSKYGTAYTVVQERANHPKGAIICA